MVKEINAAIVILSVIAGILNFFFLGLALALTSGGPEMTTNEIVGHICIWTSLIHVIVSSWLFIYKRIGGNILGLLSSVIGIIGPFMIMTDGISFLWLTIAICFSLTAIFHIVGLINVEK